MKTNLIKTVIVLFLGVFTTYAQRTKKADKAYQSYAYIPAIEAYESLLEKGMKKADIYKHLGTANYVNAKYEEAYKWYHKLAEGHSDVMDAESYYNYAQSLKSMGRYNEADQVLKKYLAKVDENNIIASKIKNQKDYLKQIEINSGRFEIENIKANSTGSDFAPSMHNGKLYFASARDTGVTVSRLHQWNNKRFLDIYESKEGAVEKLSKKINTKFHESTSIFTKDGKTMYFTRNNFVKGSFKKDQKGVIRLKIYKATLKDGKWKDVVELPFNSSDYSVAHPALSPDEKTLYFASDMDGSYGKSDLFSVQIHEDGTYGKPQNLGSNINTEGTESFPFVSTKGHLYFTSNGHPGLGGYDIFVVELNDKDFGTVKNVGTPINGTQDDFTFVIDEGAQKGYFASNRKGGKGDDDIYAFQETQPLSFDCTGSISGIVMDSETQKVLSNTKVYITNTTTGEIKEVVSDDQGAYAFEVNCKELDYRLMANKSFYDGYKESLQLTRNEIKDYRKNIELKKQDLTKVLNLKPIYFDFDKATILVQSEKELQKVIDYMNQFPEINVDIRSHTDSRGTARYNLKLSGERAEATMAYLIAKGIAKDRLTAKGYGETELLNNCKDHHKCTEEAHQINRRSEFIVTEK